MGRNKDSLIALAEKLTGETCGNVLTKKDALKKIACFYAGEEVECNTVADALQCIAEHCSGGGGASGGGESSGSGSNESVKTHYMAFSLSENVSPSTNKATWEVKAINPYFSNFILLNSLTDEELTGKSVFVLANKELNKGDIITTDEIEYILFLNSNSSVYEFMLCFNENEIVTAREINLVSAKIKDFASDTYEADCSEVLNLVITD